MKKLLLIVFFIPLALSAIAQDTVYSSSGKPISQYRLKEKEKENQGGFNKSKLIFGGGFIFSLGNGYFNGGLSPIIGYRISDNFAAGVGLGYQYLSVKDYFPLQNPNTGAREWYPLRTSLYTGSIWARYVVWNNIFVHAEPEINMVSAKEPYYDATQTPPGLKKRTFNSTFPRMLVGGGLRQPLSDRTSLVITVLYDVLRDKNSVYSSPLDIRFGVNVGF